jgi:hypothetical protein
MKPSRQFQSPKQADLEMALKLAQIQKLQASAYKDRQEAFEESMASLNPMRNLKK